MKHKVLVIDDEFLIRLSLEEGLSDLGYQVKTAAGIDEGLSLTEQFRPEAVLLDNRLGPVTGMDYLDAFRRIDEDVVIVMITSYGSVSQAVAAIKKGAYDFVQKPFDIEEIDILLRRAHDQLKNRRSLALLRSDQHELIGVSGAIAHLREQIRILAAADVDILICGETGTGKEVVVNRIHRTGARSEEPLVKINCGAIPENLLESELFGYEKGAFTGAVRTKKGLMELANGGTVFLDEIGELPLAMQTKLLTFLEDRCFKRVGGLNDIEVNVRVIAATNRRLEQEMAAGRFREDLFYRLNIMQIEIPPLRERREDIRMLCEYYLAHFNRKFAKSITGISPEFLEDLRRYDWKGNVRELKNVIERCVLFCNGEVLEKTRLLEESAAAAPTAAAAVDSFPLKDLTQGAINLQQEVERFETAYIERALALCGNNYSRAARLLGSTRFTLKRRLGGE